MTASFIIDCSITMTWCFDDERTLPTDGLLDRLKYESVLVPIHWSLEVVNVLMMAERKGRYSRVNADRFLEMLAHFKIDTDKTIPIEFLSIANQYCRKHRLTSYDAAYLELAMRTALPLATLDQDLRKAASAEGVSLLGL